jgi:hypothetical protein
MPHHALDLDGPQLQPVHRRPAVGSSGKRSIHSIRRRLPATETGRTAVGARPRERYRCGTGYRNGGGRTALGHLSAVHFCRVRPPSKAQNPAVFLRFHRRHLSAECDVAEGTPISLPRVIAGAIAQIEPVRNLSTRHTVAVSGTMTMMLARLSGAPGLREQRVMPGVCHAGVQPGNGCQRKRPPPSWRGQGP